MLGLLHNRNFGLVWLAALVSEAGDWLLLVGLPIYVFELTGSSLMMSTVFIIELAPTLLFGSVAGVIVDRWDRRGTMLVVSVAQALLLLPLLAVQSSTDLWIVYLVTSMEAVLAVLFEPAKNALLPTLVAKDEIVSANSLIAVNANLGRLLGAPLGGLLVATGGLPGIVTGDAVTFLLTAGLLAFVRAPKATPNDTREPGSAVLPPLALWRSWLDGVATFRRDRQATAALVIAALTGIAQGLFVVLIIVFVKEVLDGDGTEIGLLRGVQAIGGVVGGLLIGLIGARLTPARLLQTSLFGFGVLSLAIWNAPSLTHALGLYVALFALAGTPGIGAMSGLLSLLQQRLADTQLGRAFGFLFTTYTGCQALGLLLGGLLAGHFSVVRVLNGQASLYLLAGVTALVCLHGQQQTTSESEHQILKKEIKGGAPAPGVRPESYPA